MRFYQRSLDGKIGCQIRKTGIGRTGNHFHRQTSSTASRQVRFIHSFCQRLYQAEQTGEGEEVDSKDHSPNEGSLKLTVALSAIAPNSVNVAVCFHLTNWTWQAYKYSERLREGATGQTINQKRFTSLSHDHEIIEPWFASRGPMTVKCLIFSVPKWDRRARTPSKALWPLSQTPCQQLPVDHIPTKDLRIKPMSLEKVGHNSNTLSQPHSLDRTKPVWPLLSADHVPLPACKSIAGSAKAEKILVSILPFHHWKVLWRYPACCQLCFLAGWLPVKGIQGSEATKHSWNPSLGDQEFSACRNPTALLAKS